MNRLGSVPVGRMLDSNHTTTTAELYFRVLLWIEANPCGPLKEASIRLADHFDVSRSTAYRWLSAYKAAKGVA